jgi:N-methylhydantoinase A
MSGNNREKRVIELAIDIGGTFTDLAFFDLESKRFGFRKVLTTPSEPSKGVAAAIDSSDISVSDVKSFVHGTTAAINAVIEKTGARTALLTTRGFRDVLELARGNRPEAYNIYFRRLEPLVPRELRFEITERVSGSGEVLEEPNLTEAEMIVQDLRANGIEALAICFINSYRNPQNEVAVASYIKNLWPEGIVCISNEISREYREFERSSTTVVNAYVSPRIIQYLSGIEDRVLRPRFKGPFYVMQSNAGIDTAEKGKKQPVYIIESGPVAGVIGSSCIGEVLGCRNLVAFDMGGTTAKACLVVDGTPPTTDTYYVGGYGTGYPLQIPALDMVEVGAGGGSIAWVDSVGSIKVGPKSAGADPGPVCYGRGGTEPTVTDANLVLGRLNSQYFLGGGLSLNRDAAINAIQTRLSLPFGRSVAQMADGVVRLANLAMAEAVRLVTVRRGLDPRDFVLIAYGGAGPLHAGAIARELSIPVVIIPPVPGNFSAIGMLLTDVRRDYSVTFLGRLDEHLLVRLERECETLEQRGENTLSNEIPDLQEIVFTRYGEMRYVGQNHSVRVPLPKNCDTTSLRVIRQNFDSAYARQYGHSWPGQPAEITAIRVIATGLRPHASIADIEAQAFCPSDAGREEKRDVFLPNADGYVPHSIYRRVDLQPGAHLKGPVIIEEPSSTTIVESGDSCYVDTHGYLIIKIGGDQNVG